MMDILNLQVIAPWLVVALTGIAVLMVDLFLPADKKGPVVGLSIAGLASAFIVNASQWAWVAQAEKPITGFGRMVITDHISLFFNGLFIVSCGLVILLSVSYLKEYLMNYGEYYALLLFAACGMMIMSSSLDLIVLLLGLE